MENCCYLSYQPNVELDLIIFIPPCYKLYSLVSDLSILLLYTELYYLIIHSLIHSFYRYLLAAYYVPNSAL